MTDAVPGAHEVSERTRSRAETAIGVLGHPDDAERPVEEDVHYSAEEIVDVDGVRVPVMVTWESGPVDTFTMDERSRANRSEALRAVGDGPEIRTDGGTPTRLDAADFERKEWKGNAIGMLQGGAATDGGLVEDPLLAKVDPGYWPEHAHRVRDESDPEIRTDGGEPSPSGAVLQVLRDVPGGLDHETLFERAAEVASTTLAEVEGGYKELRKYGEVYDAGDEVKLTDPDPPEADWGGFA